MTITAEAGPQVIYGFTQTSSGGVTEYNEERGPSLNDLGQGMLDPRPPYCYYPGAAVGTKVRGFWNGYAAVDQIPGTVSTNCVAATQQTSVGNITLSTTGQANNTVTTPNLSLAPPEGGAAVTIPVTIDSTVALPAITYGSGGTIAMWDPTRAISRRVSISVTYLTTTSSYDNGVVYTIAGRDVYGYKVSETITGTNAASSQTKTYTSLKAYKYIQNISVTASSASYVGSTGIFAGVVDQFGLPFFCPHAAYATVWTGASSNATLNTLSSLHTFGSTATATSTTPDVRGVFTSSVATSTANGVKIIMFATPQLQNLPSLGANPSSGTQTSFTDYSGLFGVTQFSSV